MALKNDVAKVRIRRGEDLDHGLAGIPFWLFHPGADGPTYFDKDLEIFNADKERLRVVLAQTAGAVLAVPDAESLVSEALMECRSPEITSLEPSTILDFVAIYL